jgi:hypothetical protein
MPLCQPLTVCLSQHATNDITEETNERTNERTNEQTNKQARIRGAHTTRLLKHQPDNYDLITTAALSQKPARPQARAPNSYQFY